MLAGKKRSETERFKYVALLALNVEEKDHEPRNAEDL